MHKVVFFLLQLLRCSAAFTAIVPASLSRPQQRSSAPAAATAATKLNNSRLHMMSQWDEDKDDSSASAPATAASSSTAAKKESSKSGNGSKEDDTSSLKQNVSYEDAGQQLMQQENRELMEGMSDFDTNPQYNEETVKRIQEAIRKRAEALGIEKSDSIDRYAKEIEESRRAQIEKIRSDPYGMLDLTQITDGLDDDEEFSEPKLDNFFTEADLGLTDEEKAEADPIGELPFIEQVKYELSQSEWPTPLAALKEATIVLASIVVSAAIIVVWDQFLRGSFIGLGILPSVDDLSVGSEEMVLPDGWTNGMTEDDYMNFRDEVVKQSTQVIESAKSALGDFVSENLGTDN